MATMLIAFGSLVFYLVAYHTYGRWLARKIFALDPAVVTPATELRDDVDYVPSRKEVVFGHHFTSIAGTGPIVGPAIAIIWGWLPALIWVLVGSVVMGAVHDFGALVVSMRNRGASLADVAGVVVCPRARALVMAVIFFELLIVVAIFALVIASVFALYPHSVVPVWLEIPIALVLGAIIARARSTAAVWIYSIIAVIIMYGTVYIGSIYPLKMPGLFGMPPTVIWVVVLLAYAFLASVLPVHWLLQPRDFMNSHQLFIAMALLLLGIVVAQPEIVAPAVNEGMSGSGAPPFFPFLFITVACGAISGFHGLVGSGTSSKQLRSEEHAQSVGYGAMLMEGFLAVIVILAVSAGLGMEYRQSFTFSPADTAEPRVRATIQTLNAAGTEAMDVALPTKEEVSPKALSALKGLQGFRARNPEVSLNVPEQMPENVEYTVALTLRGRAAWSEHYRSWGAAQGLRPKLAAFVDGSANMMNAYGIPLTLGLAIMGVFVASFAGTTLDTATRLQRYIVAEFGRTARVKPLENRYIATALAVGTAAGLALWDGKGAGAMILWPLFGALNQLLASLVLIIIGVYLYRRRKPVWIVVLPFLFMFVMTAWAMGLNVKTFITGSDWLPAPRESGPMWHLVVIGCIVLVFQVWLTVEAALIWVKIRRERAGGGPTETPA